MSATTSAGARKHRGRERVAATDRRAAAKWVESARLLRARRVVRAVADELATSPWRGAGCESALPGSAVSVRHDAASAAFVEIGTTLSRPLDAGVRVRLELGAGIVLELSRA